MAMLVYRSVKIPGTLKLTASLPLKINGWIMKILLGRLGLFSGAKMLVSGRVQKKNSIEWFIAGDL